MMHKRKQVSMAALACVVFILDGLTIVGCSIQAQSAAQKREHTHRVIDNLEAIDPIAQSLGGHSTRYMVTGNQSSLRGLAESETKIQKLLDDLAVLVKDEREQQALLLRLRGLVGDRINWEHHRLEVFKTQGKAQVDLLNQTLRGLNLLESIRACLKEMENSERVLLEKRSQEYEQSRLGAFLAIILLSASGGLALWQAIKMSGKSARLEADRGRAYDQLEQLNKQLNKQVADLSKSHEEANQALMARSQFLARVSHELRTPLVGIIGATELVLKANLSDQEHELVSVAKESGKTLLALVNDILDFERLELQNLTIESADFALHEAISSCLEPLKIRAGDKGIFFQVNIHPDVPQMVYSDRLRFQQILSNLADNAVKFTQNGTVAVDVTTIARSSTKVDVSISVKDTGVGIAPNQLEQIFEPFVQADRFTTRQFGGSGLGLAISKKLAELLGGSIEVKSQPDKGSEFVFQVSLAFKAVTEVVPEKPVASPVVSLSSSPSILVVDDNMIIRQVSKSQLKTLGCDVEVVSTGQEAVEITGKRRFDVILMDIQMPGMDGIATTNAIRSTVGNLCADVPVVAYTAHAMKGDEEKFLAAGLSDYLAKPVMLEDMRRILAKYVKLSPDEAQAQESSASKDLAVPC